MTVDVMQAIEARRSVRAYTDEPISDEIVQELLRAAQLAPSGGNGQAHVFGVVRDPLLKRALAQAAGGQMWIATAPVVFACCARLDPPPQTLPEDDFGWRVNCLRFGEEFMNLLKNHQPWEQPARLMADAVDLIPMENILLAATARGLGGCMVGWLDVKKAGEILRLPDGLACMYLLPIGRPARQPGSKKLKTLDEISFTDTYKA